MQNGEWRMKATRATGQQAKRATKPITAILLDPSEVRRGSEAFRSREKRDAMYRVATFLVNHYWGAPSDMADGLGVLLLTWNQALYRYGSFDFDALERVLRQELPRLSKFRAREIASFAGADEPAISELFSRFLSALQIADGKKKGVKSPVAVAKALHLLAPRFFPLWDDKIAKAYDCSYTNRPAAKYLAFMRISSDQAGQLEGVVTDEWGVLKIIDEYNYAKFTKAWV